VFLIEGTFMAKIGKKQLIKLQKKYKTDEAIAKIYGLSRQAVQQYRKRCGIGPIADKYGQRNEKIRELYKKGVSVIKISKMYNMTTTHIYRIIKSK
jgi:predicted transcriptional regulator